LFAGQVEVLSRATRAHVKRITTGGVVRDMATDVARNRVVVTNEDGTARSRKRLRSKTKRGRY
jgi:hypothetical protein